MLNGDFVAGVNNEISDNIWFCFIVAVAVLGSVVVEILVTVITYCICRKCFDEKVGELNIQPLPDELAAPAQQ